MKPKLVRDKIPAIIMNKDIVSYIRIVDTHEYELFYLKNLLKK